MVAVNTLVGRLPLPVYTAVSWTPVAGRTTKPEKKRPAKPEEAPKTEK